MLQVAFGGRTVLLPGDCEQLTWDRLAALEDAGYVNLTTDVLFASHHGRNSGYPDNGVMDRLNPEAIIISTDKLPREHNAAPRYGRIATTVSTRWEGVIQMRIWDDGQLLIVPAADPTRELVRLRALTLSPWG